MAKTPTVSAVCGSLPHTAQTAEPLQRKAPYLVKGTMRCHHQRRHLASARAKHKSCLPQTPRSTHLKPARHVQYHLSAAAPRRSRARRCRPVAKSPPANPVVVVKPAGRALDTLSDVTEQQRPLQRSDGTSPGRRATHRPPGGHPRARLPPHQPPLHRARVGGTQKNDTESGPQGPFWVWCQPRPTVLLGTVRRVRSPLAWFFNGPSVNLPLDRGFGR